MCITITHMGYGPKVADRLMDFLGKIKEITNDGRLIVECETTPEIGQAVFDTRQTKVGIVNRVFGPVDGPYASVESTHPEKNKLKGADLYTRGGNANGKNKGRSRRNRSMSRMRKSPSRA